MTPERIQRQRVKGWRMPDGAVYVGRPSKWGNPWRVGDGLCRDSSDAVCYYEDWLHDGTNYVSDQPPPNVDDIRADLAGKDLACWCPLDQACHADVLLEIANAPQGAEE